MDFEIAHEQAILYLNSANNDSHDQLDAEQCATEARKWAAAAIKSAPGPRQGRLALIVIDAATKMIGCDTLMVKCS